MEPSAGLKTILRLATVNELDGRAGKVHSKSHAGTSSRTIVPREWEVRWEEGILQRAATGVRISLETSEWRQDSENHLYKSHPSMDTGGPCSKVGLVADIGTQRWARREG